MGEKISPDQNDTFLTLAEYEKLRRIDPSLAETVSVNPDGELIFQFLPELEEILRPFLRQVLQHVSARETSI